MNFVAIIQARSDSTRYPNKVTKLINNTSILEIIIRRLKLCKNINKISLATTDLESDKKLIDIAKKNQIEFYCGNERNVLMRYYKAAIKFKATDIIRVTGDCPFIDPKIVDSIVKLYKSGNFDYVSNTLLPTFPDGLDTEVFSMNSLKKANLNATSKYDKEHVTPYLKRNKFIRRENFTSKIDNSSLRLTLDTKVDYENIKKIYKYFKNNFSVGSDDVIKAINEKKISIKNENLIRDYGAKMSSGNKMWTRAMNVIPGGNMLFSKRPDLFLPDRWPTYFSKAKDCYVWDLDNKKYLDFGLMGVGTNILGYCNKYVDKKVNEAIRKGNMSSLNNPDEVVLAEKIVELHDWSHMVKFCRTGGEANAVAIRIARAASGRENVAICGYHGWHDWYLASNLSNKSNLNTHLLQGLETEGVSNSLKNTVHTFQYNNYEELESLVKSKNIGIIKMEVMRNYEPKNNFLKKVRKLATKKNIILIFDECTSGFRETYGGLHLKYKVNPDMAIFGKAIGNGYALTAVIGKKEIMDYAQKSFISSTFWTEKIGTVAALETLRIMKEEKSWRTITNLGKKYFKNLQVISKTNKLEIIPIGLRSLQSYLFKSENHSLFKTYVTQEMLKKKILATNSIYFCTKHDEKMLENYIDILNDIFYRISQSIKSNSEKSLLDGKIASSGFTRVN